MHQSLVKLYSGGRMMLLAIDIGNTTVSLGIVKGKKVIARFSIDVGITQARLRDQFRASFGRIKRQYSDIDNIVVCSVVPKALKLVELAVVRAFKIQPKVVGRDIKVPLKNNYRKPSQVGQDRLVGAYAAKC